MKKTFRGIDGKCTRIYSVVATAQTDVITLHGAEGAGLYA